jgi:hypothetical protein
MDVRHESRPPLLGGMEPSHYRQRLRGFSRIQLRSFLKVNKWSDQEYEDFIETLTLILKKYAWFGICGSVVTADYNALPSWLKKRIGGRYHFCFHVLMHQLADRLRDTVSDLPPFMVFERKDKVIGRTLDDFVEINDFRLGSMVFDTKPHVPMLQTADFLVYEINRLLGRQIYTGEQPRVQVRKLVGHAKKRYKFPRSGYHDKDTLAPLVKHLESDPDHKIWNRDPWWPDSWYPNYVKPKPDKHQRLLRSDLLWNQAQRQKPRL